MRFGTARPVVLDACVLVPQSLCDLLLRLAEVPRLYRPVWTEEIMEEAHRALTQRIPKKWPKASADRWRAAITLAFPEAEVSPSPALIPRMTNHPGDWHVLAAAIEADAEVIVTSNLRHFRIEDLAPWKIKAFSPDQFLLELYALNPVNVMHKVDLMSRSNRKVPTLELLKKHVPLFVARIEEDMRPGAGAG
jgi:predicted nucleic acid-binding protein